MTRATHEDRYDDEQDGPGAAADSDAFEPEPVSEDADMDPGGNELSAEAAAELAALAEEEAVAEAERARGERDEAVAAAVAAVRRELAAELERERSLTRAAVARYREAALAAEPALPPELVAGDSLDAVERSLNAARRTVAQIRERLASEQAAAHRAGGSLQPGFPIGAPERGQGGEALSAGEKIAQGLRERA